MSSCGFCVCFGLWALELGLFDIYGFFFWVDRIKGRWDLFEFFLLVYGLQAMFCCVLNYFVLCMFFFLWDCLCLDWIELA